MWPPGTNAKERKVNLAKRAKEIRNPGAIENTHEVLRPFLESFGSTNVWLLDFGVTSKRNRAN